MSLPELDINHTYFLDKTTLLFGESGTGKSFVMVDILYQLKPHVDQIIVISPTDRQNHTYDRGTVPIPCIHYTISAQLLDSIWDRQTALSSVYTRATNMTVLKGLYEKIPNNHTASAVIESIHKKLRDFKLEVGNDSVGKAKVANMEKECKKLITMIWKNSIDKSRGWLVKQRLNEDQKFSLQYLNLNPRLVLIFDDCTDQLKAFKSHPVMQKLFYQGRWAYITALIACHTDKALSGELRKNAYVSIFTEETSAHTYFTRATNDLDKDAKIRASNASKVAFTPMAEHQKLVWIKTEKKFYRFTATAHENFKFGSQYIWEYCDQIKAEEGSISTSNKFIQDFL